MNKIIYLIFLFILTSGFFKLSAHRSKLTTTEIKNSIKSLCKQRTDNTDKNLDKACNALKCGFSGGC